MTTDDLLVAAGYSGTGTPEAAVQMLLGEVTRARAAADSYREQYQALLDEVAEAIDHSVAIDSTGDPIRRLRALSEQYQRLISVQAQVPALLRTLDELRVVYPAIAAEHEHPADFVEALAEHGGADREEEISLRKLSCEYFQAISKGDAAAIPRAAVAWQNAVESLLEELD